MTKQQLQEASEVSKITQSNSLTTARYQFSLLEKRVIYLIIKEVRAKHIVTKVGEKTVWNELIIHLTPKMLNELETNVPRIIKALFDLRQKTIDIEDLEGNRLIVGFANYATYDKKTNSYEIEVSRKLLPHLAELSDQFTTYELMTIITLKSIYSQRLYEFCSMYRNKGYFFFDIDKFRFIMMLENKYLQMVHLKNNVLEIARKEIKDAYDKGSCDIYFDYSFDEKTKIGKQYTRIHFKVFNREAKEVKIESLDTLKKLIRETVKPLFKTDASYTTSIITYAEQNPDAIDNLLSKISRIALDADKLPTDKAKLIRTILKADFGIIKAKKA